MPLNDQRQSFVRAYCANGGNATQAAIEAGYSERTARAQGSRLLTFVDVQQEIEKWRADMAERSHITIENQTAELVKDRELARENGQVSAAIQATGLILKAHGLLTEDRKNARDPLTEAMDKVAKREEKRLH